MSLRKNKAIYLILLALCILFPRVCYQDEIYIFNNHYSDKIKNPEISQSDINISSYLVPSVPESISSNQIIKIGLLDDLNDISGDHAWKGALLAAREVNEAGGILINGTNYYVGLVAENTNEVYGTRSEGIEAAETIIYDHHPHFIIGGQADSLKDYKEVVMEKKIPFLGTGAIGDDHCGNVQNNYERYKYFFRIMPLNATSMAIDLISYLVYLCYYLNSIDAGTVNKTAILRQNIFAFDAFADAINYFLPTDYGISVLADISFSADAKETDFINYWNQIESMGVQVVCLMLGYYLPQTAKLLFQIYQQIQPQCIIVSFSPFGQLNTDWDYVEGSCQFDIIYQAIYNTSKTPLTIPFFTRYVNDYDIEPFYTGTGSYDAVKLLVQTVQETQTFDPNITVSALEKINASNPYIGAGGNLSFTNSHDILRGYPYGYGLFCQWKYIDGTKVVVPSGLLYPDTITTGSLRLPYWGINGLLTDPPQPPGNFTINSTAEAPDLDGKFNLTWTDSEGADNYSIYMSDNPFTYISKEFEIFAYQTATPPFSISLKKGEYYFRVVAYNETGEKMSSNDVYINIPGPGSFSLASTARSPDTDGKFDLVWANSERAVNYSVFRYSQNIIDINESLVVLANQTAQSPFSITRLPNGRYFFAVAAYNEMGYTLSNNEYIIVRLSIGIIILILIIIIPIGIIVGIGSVVLIKKYLKRVKKLEKIDKNHKLKN